MEINFNPFPALDTGRLVLRRLTMNDCYELLQLRTNDSVNQYLDRNKSMNMDEATAFVEKINKVIDEQVSVYWVISLKNDPKLIGTICLWNFEPDKDLVELGYELMPAHQGKGIMQEAAERVIGYAFDVLKVKIITAVTHPDNAASVKLLTRNRFKPDKNHTYVSETDAEGLVAYFLLSDKD
jgi:[ribosomal protein S5]-alanine N-acetyltransferase